MNSSGSGPADVRTGATAALLDRVRIVLSQPSLPRNIGSTARAMKTMGLARLYLVEPRSFPHPDAEVLASGATDVLERARVCAAFDDSLAGTTLAFALSARRRELSHPASDARAAVAIALAEAAAGGEVAFVFGNETSGLANEEVIRCQRLVHIPANPGYSSLNLSQAVQIIAYELWAAASSPADFRNARQAEADERGPAPLATYEEVERFYAHLERAIVASGFLDPDHPRRLMERFRRLYGRARLEKEEINILRGVLAAFENPRPRNS